MVHGPSGSRVISGADTNGFSYTQGSEGVANAEFSHYVPLQPGAVESTRGTAGELCPHGASHPEREKEKDGQERVPGGDGHLRKRLNQGRVGMQVSEGHGAHGLGGSLVPGRVLW